MLDVARSRARVSTKSVPPGQLMVECMAIGSVVLRVAHPHHELGQHVRMEIGTLGVPRHIVFGLSEDVHGPAGDAFVRTT